MPAILLASLLLTAIAGPAGAVRASGRFTITDDMAAAEISETTTIYLDGKALARLRLDADTPSRTIDATVDDAEAPHRYALCGEITVRRPGGSETHEVDSGGIIADVSGRRYQALGAADFTFFYLADPMPGRVPSVPERGHAPPCQTPIS